MSELKYVHFKELCQAGGLKVTPQRYIIWKTLAETEVHPTADHLFTLVHEKLPGLGRDTVFRTLNTFAECGLASKLTTPGGATHYDGDTGAHHHFLCASCGSILDLLWPSFEALPWPEELFILTKPRQAAVLFTGTCRSCDPGGWAP